MKKVLLSFALFFLLAAHPVFAETTFFHVQSVDTMKYSRDRAREKLEDTSFDKEIDAQVGAIAKIGATHVAVGTPYEDEFIPFLRKWVSAARKYSLHVWFRGNLAGWEGWFDYPKIDRATHTKNIDKFIRKYPDLFQDGDIFVTCPECENGGPGDPRQTGDVVGFRNFLIEEKQTADKAFRDIGVNVETGYFSTNGDVARLAMNPETAKAIGGYIIPDHYVITPEKLAADLADMAKNAQANVVLGEFGAPIPDINGDMTDDQQAQWIDDAMQRLIKYPKIIALNYWTNLDSSTSIFHSDNTPRKAALVLEKYFKPRLIEGKVTDKDGVAVSNVTVMSDYRDTKTDKEGKYDLPVLGTEKITFEKNNYATYSMKVSRLSGNPISLNVELEPQPKTFMEKLFFFIRHLLSR